MKDLNQCVGLVRSGDGHEMDLAEWQGPAKGSTEQYCGLVTSLAITDYTPMTFPNVPGLGSPNGNLGTLTSVSDTVTEGLPTVGNPS